MTTDLPIAIDDPSLGEYRFVRYGFSFTWLRDDDTGCKITDETIEISSKERGPWTNYLKRADGKYKKVMILVLFDLLALMTPDSQSMFSPQLKTLTLTAQSDRSLPFRLIFAIRLTPTIDFVLRRWN